MIYQIFTGIVLLAADLFTKQWAQVALVEKPIVIIPDLLQLQLHFNSGIAFSLPVPSWLQIILTILIIGYLVYVGVKNFSPLRYVILLVIAGALGNLYERIIYGQVTDFIAVWQFPVFNLADAFVSLGVLGFLILELRK